MERKFDCIMFDLDGTILDTIEDVKNNINLTMTEFGHATHTREEVCSYINDGAMLLIKRALLENGADDEYVKKVLSRYLEIYEEHVADFTKPYDGVLELMRKLKSEGYILCVVSNKPSGQVKLLTEKFFDKDAFSYISGTGIGIPSKPAKECIEKPLEKLGISKDKVLYVGDSHVDAKTAKNAEVKCAGVTWGFHGKGGFKDQVCDYYADNCDELYQIISGKIEGATL